MKKFFQILGICSILVFSFYYTDKIMLIVQEKNPILKEIRDKEKSLSTNATNATVMKEYIIPGVSGSAVNVEQSFYNMKALNAFNEYYLIYDEVKPTISLENHKDKIIISGNKTKKQISLVLEYNQELIDYMANYNVSLLVNKNNYNKALKYEMINNENDQKKFNQLNSLLNKDKLNKNICLINENNKNNCQKEQNYLVQNSLTLSKNNLIDVKNSVENGSIILIKKDVTLKDMKILLEQIKFQDLNIVYLSDLIKE